MTARWEAAPRKTATKRATPVSASVPQRAESRERAAPPAATRRIAVWVNEGEAKK
jgi:hypothetical protein